tara:strand:- start:257 stop:499 length:243 start_codon:yes stop_codon:yes gene_type:complete
MDSINTPKHYIEGRKYQPLDILEDWDLVKNHYLACAFKYIARCGRKDDALTDLKKAVFYLEREIHRRENKNVLHFKKRDT